MKRDRALPEWATVGATAWLAPNDYSRQNKFCKVTITRVTKTSIFVVTNTHSTGERRFVDSGYSNWGGNPERVFQEYGNKGDAWHRPAYLYGADSIVVASGLAASQRDEAYYAATRAVEAFTTQNPQVSRKASAEASIKALTAYLAVIEGQGNGGTI